MVELAVPAGIVNADAVLEIDGTPQEDLMAGLLSLIVEETAAGLARCEARFGNWGSQGRGVDYLYFDRSVLDFGMEFAVRMGAGRSEGEIFRGHISALEGEYRAGAPPAIVVLAEDKGQALRVTRRTRVFEEMSDADAFAQIADEHGLRAEIDLDGPTHALLAQINQSDLAFMRERIRQLDADLWFDGDTLHVQGCTARGEATPEAFTLGLNRGLIDFRVTADTANQYTKVVVSGWDVAAKDRISQEAGAETLTGELDGDTGGGKLVEQAFGARIDRLVHQNPLTGDEAAAIAAAVYRAQARRFVTGRGTARGDARLRVGTIVRLDGLGPLFSGRYIIREARHLFTRDLDGGYVTEFAVERAGIGG